jgi:hypothetical protein
MADVYNITIEQYADYNLQLQYKDAAGSAINLTNYLAQMDVRNIYSNPETVLSLDSSQGTAITLGGTAGTITLFIDGATTGALDPKFNYKYDLVLTSPANKVTRLIQGNITVDAGITRI